MAFQDQLAPFLQDIGWSDDPAAAKTAGPNKLYAVTRGKLAAGYGSAESGARAKWENVAKQIDELIGLVESGKDPAGVTQEVSRQVEKIVRYAQAAAAGKRPRGRCYEAVWNYIKAVGYGKMPAVGPMGSQLLARNFADYANRPGNAEKLGIKKLPIDNPYKAPRGAIVVVRAGTPGTRHATAGDITIAAGGGIFYNDGQMSYGGPGVFKPGNDYVLGIYMPL